MFHVQNCLPISDIYVFITITRTIIPLPVDYYSPAVSPAQYSVMRYWHGLLDTFTFLNNCFFIKSKINVLQPYVSLADFDYPMKGIPETRRACQIRYLCIITLSWHINCTCTTFRFWSINVYLYWGYQLCLFLWFWWNILELFRLWYIFFFNLLGLDISSSVPTIHFLNIYRFIQRNFSLHKNFHVFDCLKHIFTWVLKGSFERVIE